MEIAHVHDRRIKIPVPHVIFVYRLIHARHVEGGGGKVHLAEGGGRRGDEELAFLVHVVGPKKVREGEEGRKVEEKEGKGGQKRRVKKEGERRWRKRRVKEKGQEKEGKGKEAEKEG